MVPYHETEYICITRNYRTYFCLFPRIKTTNAYVRRSMNIIIYVFRTSNFLRITTFIRRNIERTLRPPFLSLRFDSREKRQDALCCVLANELLKA